MLRSGGYKVFVACAMLLQCHHRGTEKRMSAIRSSNILVVHRPAAVQDIQSRVTATLKRFHCRDLPSTIKYSIILQYKYKDLSHFFLFLVGDQRTS
jgi:hypothetical protein